MPSKLKPILFRPDPETYKAIKALAKEEKRTTGQQTSFLVEIALAQIKALKENGYKSFKDLE